MTMNGGTYRGVLDTDATTDAVWRVIDDIAAWPTWQEFDAVHRVPPTDGADGTEECWDLLVGVFRTRIRVTSRVPGQHLAYRAPILFGMRDYESRIEVEPTSAGARVVWAGRFVPTVPGTALLWRPYLNRLIGTHLTDLGERVRTPETGPVDPAP